MQLCTNSIDVETVREEERNGREYLVANVTVARPMSLNGGYVPDEAFAESVPGWNHVPLPIGHPVDVHGNYITARLPEVIDNAVTGSLYYASYDTDERELNGDLWVDVEQTETLGVYGERIIEILEDGDELEVSSAYRGDPGTPGVYEGVDGESYRDEVKVNLRPDHVALLPDDLGPGKCSCSDGCGVDASDGIVENALATVDESETPVTNTIGVSGHTPPSAGPEGVPGAGYCVNGQPGRSADRVFVNMRPPEGGRDRPSTPQSSEEGDYDMELNQSEDDRVRWEAENTDETRYGIVADELDDDDESVLVAVYEQVPTDDDDDSVEWENTDEEETVLEENLTVIEEFPSEQIDSNGVTTNGNRSSTSIQGNILSEARTPEYDETMSVAAADAEGLESWELWWGLDEYLEAWADATDADYQGDPYSALSEVPDGARGWIARKSLLGNPDAETEDNLLMGAVVSPDGVLHEELLEDVLGTTGSRWTIPDEQRESAREVARQLLVDEFGHDFEDGDSTADVDANEAAGILHSVGSLLQRAGLNSSRGGGDTACDCNTGTHEECHCSANGRETKAINSANTNTSSTTMGDDITDDDYERIANATEFSSEQLRRMDSNQLESLNTLVENAAEASEEGGDGGTDTDDVDVNSDIDALPDAFQDELSDLRQTVNAQQEVIDELNANRDANEQRRRKQATDVIQANSNRYSDEQLDEMDTEVLETTANALQEATSAADWGGLNEPFPSDIDGNADEDEGTTSTGGSFAEYAANQKAESSD
ncbi:hypothetical protein [Halalkalicoccus jeotgali]|uniref:DUF2213 domain-containing protein n=1 Tax=Halalkalicoccus jeotgali (strain DSM 18796 / CECT 7217 / JCM 14584 / KCTC 4019 / B3) TaxID=795797 RepID=D8J9W1_HALJB|nr:hypothetical protein [Halalkalicoccus jeotgali]ADJ14483.1 hypothetical protein HacjB3_05460 [Halalkalicoccus jeotgali B3]ELY40197.1 hypothetical protein C497_03835 [Halalkalicoccus jeotgali B3]